MYFYFLVGIMTAKLLPVFLDCFSDNYVSVRMEACLSCNNLRIKDPAVLEKLVFLATYDPIWKVKALALQGQWQRSYHNADGKDAQVDIN